MAIDSYPWIWSPADISFFADSPVFSWFQGDNRPDRNRFLSVTWRQFFLVDTPFRWHFFRIRDIWKELQPSIWWWPQYGRKLSYPASDDRCQKDDVFLSKEESAHFFHYMGWLKFPMMVPQLSCFFVIWHFICANWRLICVSRFLVGVFAIDIHCGMTEVNCTFGEQCGVHYFHQEIWVDSCHCHV